MPTPQISRLNRGVDIVVGTPGRLLDLIERKALNIKHVNNVVLDEADEMLNMGFLVDVEYVLERVPARQQTAFFSATMPEPIRKLASRFLNRPASIALPQPRGMTVPTISQRYSTSFNPAIP